MTALSTTSMAVVVDEHQEQQQQQELYPDLSLNDIIEGDNGRGIPSVKFVSEDVGMFVDEIFRGTSSSSSSNSSSGSATVSAELLIGAFSQLHSKYKSSEASLQGKQENLKLKLPELQKSISAIETLLTKQQQRPKEEDEKTTGDNNNNNDDAHPIYIRYALSDNIYAKAKLVSSYTTSSNNAAAAAAAPVVPTTPTPASAAATAGAVVYLWLGANVMLEYKYDEALTFLRNNYARAEHDLATISDDLSFVRDQIVTSEVNMSRIFNWDVRRRRQMGGTTTTTTAAATSALPSSSTSSP